MPADGVKGKTWGPSTLHQRERCHLPLQRPVCQPPFSKSAPNLPPAPALQPRDLGNPAPMQQHLQIVQLPDSETKQISLGSPLRDFGLQSPDPYLSNPKFFDNSVDSSKERLYSQNSLSYNILGLCNLPENSVRSASTSNLSGNHYDTVYSTENFIITRPTN